MVRFACDLKPRRTLNRLNNKIRIQKYLNLNEGTNSKRRNLKAVVCLYPWIKAFDLWSFNELRIHLTWHEKVYQMLCYNPDTLLPPLCWYIWSTNFQTLDDGFHLTTPVNSVGITASCDAVTWSQCPIWHSHWFQAFFPYNIHPSVLNTANLILILSAVVFTLKIARKSAYVYSPIQIPFVGS